MQLKTSTGPRDTLSQVIDIARGSIRFEDVLPFALACMAMEKLTAAGRLELDDLHMPDGQFHLTSPTLPTELLSVISDALKPAQGDRALFLEVRRTVSQFLDRSISISSDLQDAAWWVTGRNRGASDGRAAYDPALCDLLVGSLEAQAGDVVWVPFDTSGQLVVRLARAGVHVWHAGPAISTELTLLLLALEDDPACLDAVTFAKGLPDFERSNPITHCLVTAPMGLRVPRTPWSQWEHEGKPVRSLWTSAEEMARSDAWAVAAMWPKATKRGVFLTSPGLLFAQGQELKLRKSLLLDQGGNMVTAAVSLPQGLLSYTGVTPTLLVLDSVPRQAGVRMVDGSGPSIRNAVTGRFGNNMDASEVLSLLHQSSTIPQLSADIDVAEIEQYEFSLMPPRYLRRVLDMSGERRVLGDLLVKSVRSPVPTKDLDSWPVWEISIPMLDRWRPIEGGYERWMTITSRKADEALLRKGDLVLSIKGTVGKVGIVGEVPENMTMMAVKRLVATVNIAEEKPKTNAAVAAASCIALRVDRQQVLPEYLLLYMRSDDFKRQLEALRVGSTIAHITPSELLSSVRVPMLPLAEQAMLCERYRELVQLESEHESLQQRMTDMRNQLFNSSNQPT